MNRLIQFLSPREHRFFELLAKQSATVEKASDQFSELLENYAKLSAPKRESIVREIRKLEIEGDEQSGAVIELLNKTLVTPYDREDIHALTVVLDDLLDLLDEIAHQLILYRVDRLPPHLIAQARAARDVVVIVRRACHQLEKLEELKRRCRELYRLEHEGDRLFERAIGDLFLNAGKKNGVMELVKYKDLYEHVEKLFNKGKDFADTLQSIVVKHG